MDKKNFKKFTQTLFSEENEKKLSREEGDLEGYSQM
jgi:hypothetical protein